MKARFDFSIDVGKTDRRTHFLRAVMRLHLDIQEVIYRLPLLPAGEIVHSLTREAWMLCKRMNAYRPVLWSAGPSRKRFHN